MFEAGQAVIVDLPGSEIDRLVGTVSYNHIEQRACSIYIPGHGYPCVWWQNLRPVSDSPFADDDPRRGYPWLPDVLDVFIGLCANVKG